MVRDQRSHLADHRAVGDGMLPLGILLHRIEEEGFTGPVILEVNSRADLRRSVGAIETLLSRACMETSDRDASPSTACR